jgi:hypothetical protein
MSDQRESSCKNIAFRDIGAHQLPDSCIEPPQQPSRDFCHSQAMTVPKDPGKMRVGHRMHRRPLVSGMKQCMFRCVQVRRATHVTARATLIFSFVKNRTQEHALRGARIFFDVEKGEAD